MPRKPLLRTNVGAYHVMARVNHRHDFPLPLRDCWFICMKLLKKVTLSLTADVHGFVLMSNHYHMLLTTPKNNIDVIMKVFNREITRAISTRTGLDNHIFGARYRWSLVYDSFSFAYVLKYIYRNPIKAKISYSVEEYPFSTVKSLLLPKMFPHINPPRQFGESFSKKEPAALLAWLNQPLKTEEESLIQKAIRRKEFQFPIDQRYQKIVDNLPPPPW